VGKNSTGLAAVTAQEIDFSLKYDELQRYWRNGIAINPSVEHTSVTQRCHKKNEFATCEQYIFSWRKLF
jgi:hypothetical protein